MHKAKELINACLRLVLQNSVSVFHPYQSTTSIAKLFNKI